MDMAQAYSLHLGLNTVNPDHYIGPDGRGWDGQLYGCENDAHDLAELARRQGFQHSEVALTQQVTADFVYRALRRIATQMQPEDLFLLTYSGHGGQVEDLNGDEDEDKDGKDETWCLYDRQLLDDELYLLWAYFPPGARLLVLSDSCHSGTVVKNTFYGTSSADNQTEDGRRYRFMPSTAARSTYRQNRDLYQKVNKAVTQEAQQAGTVKACVRLISGCQSDQFSQDLDENGLFTKQLKAVWNEGKFEGTYGKFVQAIRHSMPPEQQPNHITVGARNPVYGRQRPFTI